MKKKKIWETITRLTFAFMFVASWAVLGVALALKTAKIEIGGGITFTATDVYAKISGSVAGSKTANPIDEHSIEIDSSTSSDFTVDSSWTDMSLDFQNASTPIVVTITIENKSSDRSFWVVFADNIETYSIAYNEAFNEDDAVKYHNTDVVRKINNEIHSGRYRAPIQLVSGSSVTLETTLSIHNANYKVNDDFNLGIELIGENAIKDEGEYTKLTFTTNDTDKTASVKASSTDIEGDVVIPALFYKNGGVYTVTKIEGAEESTTHTEYVYVYSGGFANCTKMTSIYIPATITSMGQYCFSKNANDRYLAHLDTSTINFEFECGVEWNLAAGVDDVDRVGKDAFVNLISRYGSSR